MIGHLQAIHPGWHYLCMQICNHLDIIKVAVLITFQNIFVFLFLSFVKNLHSQQLSPAEHRGVWLIDTREPGRYDNFFFSLQIVGIEFKMFF
ncbi:MAG: hypothetical protein JXA41_16135 [Deltaproteobacteria bacterium]|nr:hypothetical protein [Deltaproteobacteria bacterium]